MIHNPNIFPNLDIFHNSTTTHRTTSTTDHYLNIGHSAILISFHNPTIHTFPASQHNQNICSACSAISQRAALFCLLYTPQRATLLCLPALLHHRGLLWSACSAYHRGLLYFACFALSQRATLLCLLCTSQRATLLCYFVLVHINTSDPARNRADLVESQLN